MRQNRLKLVKARDQKEIKDELGKYWFHYDPTLPNDPTLPKKIASLEEFLNKLTLEKWCNPQKFHDYCNTELDNYLKDTKDYDPIAICCAIRVKIEKILYNTLECKHDKKDFLDKHGTQKKIEFVIDKGYDICHTYCLLSLIYNTHLHHNGDNNLITPLITQLNHPIIRKLIGSVKE